MPLSYTPNPEGLPAQVMAFFWANPEEELAIEDIAEKFDVTRGNIHTLLGESVRLNLLTRVQKDGEYIYKRGTELKPKWAAKNKKAPKPPRAAPLLPKVAEVQIDDGIPIPPLHQSAKHDWIPLLQKLAVGQSFAQPVNCKSVLSGAIAVQHKSNAGKYTMRILRATEQVRVWRTA